MKGIEFKLTRVELLAILIFKNIVKKRKVFQNSNCCAIIEVFPPYFVLPKMFRLETSDLTKANIFKLKYINYFLMIL